MVGAVVLIPALSYWLLNPDRKRSRIGQAVAV